MPKLRFKNNVGADFEMPDDLTIADVFDKVKTTNKDGQNKNVITNSAEYGLIPQREFFDKDIAVEGNTDKYTIIKKGDFVYNPRKSSTAPYGPFNCYNRDEAGIVSPLYSCLKPKNHNFTPYLLHYFSSPAWYSYIYHNGNQGGARHDRVGMTDDLLMGIPVLLPCEEEQKKITDFLALYDQKISIQRGKVETLETRRKGILQQIFSQEIRFKADDGSDFEDWEYFELGSFLEEYCDRNSEQKYEPVSVGRLGIRKRSDVFNRELSQDYSKNKLIYPNTLTIGLGSKQIDMVVAPSSLPETYSVSPAYTTYKINNIDSSFLKHIVDANIALLSNRYMIVSVRQGKSVDKTNLMCHQLPIPCIEEQKKIACFMELIDQQIQVEKDKLEAIKNVKKGLLQQMFV